MNLLLLRPEDFVGGDIATVNDSRVRHIKRVLRAAVGDQLRCGLLGGDTGKAEIIQLNDSTVSLRVALTTPPPAKLPLTLLLALPRPKMARRTLRAATELGVSSIILLNSQRVEQSYWNSPLVDAAHLEAAMLEGLEQSGDTMLPRLSRARGFKPYVEDQLPGELLNKKGLLAHPYSSTQVPDTDHRHCLLAIGPEGGFIPYEMEKLEAAGLQSFSLGPRILKVETAVSAIIGRLFL